MSTFTTMQLDALRELANIGSGTAGTALSQMLGRSVDISVPNALVLPLAEAVEAVGPPEQEVTGVAIPLAGDMDAIVLLVFPVEDAGTLCAMLGVEAGTEDALSAIGEIGNILGASYIGSLGAMTGLELDLTPPQTATDMLAAIVAILLARRSPLRRGLGGRLPRTPRSASASGASLALSPTRPSGAGSENRCKTMA